MIAMAIACGPKLLIADEPTTALDVSVQAQIIELFDGLRRELGMAVLLISHDLGLIGQIADRVLIVYAGRVVESGTPDVIFACPSHPYTRGLLASIPRIDRARRTELPQINGAPPDLAAEIRGCPFAPRCPLVEARCAEDPPTTRRGPEHSAACWLTS
jgi:oligopeptide/dipeptide ABC transporter ATP-binding protein